MPPLHSFEKMWYYYVRSAMHCWLRREHHGAYLIRGWLLFFGPRLFTMLRPTYRDVYVTKSFTLVVFPRLNAAAAALIGGNVVLLC